MIRNAVDAIDQATLYLSIFHIRITTRTLLLCGYCGMVKRSDNLAEHCEKTHNDEFLALKPDERPKTPEYSNWKAYAEEYPSTEPVKNLLN